MIGTHTIKEGDRIALWSRQGRVRFVDGPRRLWIFRERLEHLKRHVVELGAYAAIHYRDGRVEHVPGPLELWEDPVRHTRIVSHDAVAIDANEAIVIYRRRDDDTVERRVEHGPSVWVPQPGEWMHEFCWHGSAPYDETLKIPGALIFTKLRIVPDQMYAYVRDVRTADDAVLTLRVMIFFELVDVDVMLDRTHDPIADFINAVSSDLVKFSSSRSFESLKKDTGQLSDLETYENLAARAASIGYRVTKVVYRGYEAGANLQAMHDEAIEQRTSLLLQRETQEQAQTIEDLKLEREAGRAAMRREIAERQAQHERDVARATHEADLLQRRERFEQDVEAERRRQEIEVEMIRAKARERTSFLEAMAALEVDLTRYLVAGFQHPDRLVRIESDGTPPQLHVFPEGEPRP